jgi:hypothetical protein
MSGPHAAGQRPGQSFFETVRSQQLESVGGFIFRQGKWQTVSVMFTLSGPQTLPHGRICSCFPDTFPPFEFRSFYPNVMSVRILFYFFFYGNNNRDYKVRSVWMPSRPYGCRCGSIIRNKHCWSLHWRSETMRPFISMGIEHTDLVSLCYRTRAADIEKLRFGLICYVDIMYVML